MQIKISDIIINDGRRAVDEETVRGLAESIGEIGLINPIIVDKDNVLIAGAHRLSACAMLGWEKIEATVVDLTGLSAELAEIDENLIRNNLFYLDRDEMLLRRKEIYEILYPETKKGGIAKTRERNKSGAFTIIDKMSNMVDSEPATETENISEADTAPGKESVAHTSFVKDTASKMGNVKKTVYRAIERAKNICPEAKEVIRGKQLPQNQADKIALLDEEDQKAVAGKISSGEIKSAGDIAKFVKTECANLPPDVGGGRKYRIIYAFPPWPRGDGKKEKEENAKAIKEIFSTPVQAMATEEAVLFMWVPSVQLMNGIKALEKWGFSYKDSFVWVKKRRGMGGGEFNAIIHEFLLIATKGNCLPDSELDVESVVQIEQDEYPGEFKRIITRMFYRGDRLMLWGEEEVDGWDFYPEMI